MDVKTRRTELKKLIEDIGVHRIIRAEMARKYGVTPTQINRDIRHIMNEMPQVNWASIFTEATQDFDRTLNIANKAMDKTSDSRLKAKLAGQISEMLLRKMSFLEKMERLLPAGAKPEPVAIIYKCVENSIFSPENTADDLEKDEGQSDEKHEERAIWEEDANEAG